jgi:glycosyltransferase involved in cell wall biosynthesis
LESVVNQNYPNFEVICVNDGSINNCAEILSEYAEKYSQVNVISKTNGGISSARNAGIEAATSNYLLFADHDNYFLQNMVLAELAEILQKDDFECVYFPVANAGKDWYVEDFYERLNDMGVTPINKDILYLLYKE